MAFVDRVVQYPNRIKLTDTNGTVTGPYTITRDEGTVTAEGTPLNAENLNNAIDETVAGATEGISIDPNGNVSFRNMQSGKATVKVAKANTVYTKSITFPQEFTAVPNVVATAQTSAPQNTHVGVTNITTSGFSITLYRDTAVDTVVQWAALL